MDKDSIEHRQKSILRRTDKFEFLVSKKSMKEIYDFDDRKDLRLVDERVIENFYFYTNKLFKKIRNKFYIQ